MPNGTYGGVRGEETKVGQKTFVSRPTRFQFLTYETKTLLTEAAETSLVKFLLGGVVLLLSLKTFYTFAGSLKLDRM